VRRGLDMYYLEDMEGIRRHVSRIPGFIFLNSNFNFLIFI
jgi:hypothetical protein